VKIILAGHTIDRDVINEFQELQPRRRDLTPETVAAAYARISRNPAPVNELRAIARGEVEKARLSNKNIVFEMGHSSIAEHAVFNIDVIGVSRLLVEEIERSRLASYTEKSQRYVLLADDFVIPDEIRAAGLQEMFVSTVRMQNAFYHELYAKLRPYIFEKNESLAADPANVSLLEGWAKEDARYCLSLATEAQLGMTLNARNAELMIRRLAALPLAEAKQFSGMLYEQVSGIAPSLVRYITPTPCDLERAGMGRAVRYLKGVKSSESTTAVAGKMTRSADESENPDEFPVRLLYADQGADDRIAAVLLAGFSGLPCRECAGVVERMAENEKRDFFKMVLREMRVHDAAPREFEHASMTLELVVSASCFAQLKRHRMATLSAQRYDSALGVTIPPSVQEIGMEAALRNICLESEKTAGKIAETAPAAASYILTNAHRRRVVMTINARELYHIARVRADRHAQWDIRRIAEMITRIGRGVMPLALMLAGGKDEFDEIYSGAFDK
jgi:flavin-dependent thymidylate synthase